ncbi:HupE/UreJ family protein [Pontimicrobium sp. IMCC45349]|uniref:HupE/UreJ family protein n=1 Tax=Pontimicrobium sp. IMCC45349 TaxID=3391574 RepID=UPI0039A29724
MLDNFLKYLELGVNHIISLNSYDHLLFLIIIAVPYLFKDWKRLLLLVTTFTIGHTITLILGVYNIISINSNLVELLIPFTILVMAIYNVFTAGKTAKQHNATILFIGTLFFGLIHGLGFANDFLAVIGRTESKIVPLLEFALGIEVGQLIVVFVILFFGFLGQTIFRFSRRDWVMVTSAIVIGVMLPLIIHSKLWS